MPDHAVMFGNLMTLLRERVTPLLAVLRSKDCQNVKTIMSKTLSQIMDSTDVVCSINFLSNTLYVRQYYCRTVHRHNSLCGICKI